MQTLEACYKEIASNTNRWSYYDEIYLSIDDAWNDNEKALRFIESYFGYGGKNEAFDDKFLQENRHHIRDRAPHIISTFLLGIKIAECYEIDINTRDENYMNFQYCWFLSCLYHDIGYVFEKGYNNKKLKHICEEGIEGFRHLFELRYIHDQIFQTYTKEVVDFYFKCRANLCESKPVIDHGIAGGLLLYDKLRRQFEKAWKNRINSKDNRESFFVRHNETVQLLHFSKNHYDTYAKAANAIIAHNIWLETLKKYIDKYGEKINISKINITRKIHLEDKLCFILALADSIEPIKRNPKYLQTVYIETIPGKQGFLLKMDNEAFSEIGEGITSIDKWVDVSICTPEKGTIQLLK